MGQDLSTVKVGRRTYGGWANWDEDIEDDNERNLSASLDIIYGAYECYSIEDDGYDMPLKLRQAIFTLASLVEFPLVKSQAKALGVLFEEFGVVNFNGKQKLYDRLKALDYFWDGQRWERVSGMLERLIEPAPQPEASFKSYDDVEAVTVTNGKVDAPKPGVQYSIMDMADAGQYARDAKIAKTDEIDEFEAEEAISLLEPTDKQLKEQDLVDYEALSSNTWIQDTREEFMYIFNAEEHEMDDFDRLFGYGGLYDEY